MDNDLSAKDKTAIHDLLIEQLDIARAQLTPEASIMDDLGADSLDVVEITMKLEEHFDFSIPDEEWDKVRTVGDLYGAVASLHNISPPDDRLRRVACATETEDLPGPVVGSESGLG